MKVLKIILVSLIVLVAVILIGAVVFIKTFDVNRFKPQILAQARTVLGRDVDFGIARLDVGLGGISLKLSDLVIADDPAFQDAGFVSVKEVAAAVDVMAYLSRKTISVPVISIRQPKIILIRSKDGALNVQTIAPAGQPAASAAAPADSNADNPQQSGSEAAVGKTSSAVQAVSPPEVQIDSFKISDGSISYIDRSFEPAMAVDIKRLDLTVDGFSLDKEFRFKAAAALFGSGQNLLADGVVQLDLRSNSVVLSDFKAVTELSDLDLKAIADLPALKGVSLPASLKGRVEVLAAKLVAGAKGLVSLQANLNIAGGNVVLKELAVPIRDINLAAQASERNIVLDKLALGLGQGTISASGKVEDYLSAQKYDLKADIKNIDIEEVLNQEKAEVKAQGKIGAAVSCQGAGFTPEAVKSSLSGGLAAVIAQAKLKDINVMRAVLDKINILPGLTQAVEAGLPQKFKDSLSSQDTSFTDMQIPVKIEKGNIIIDSAVIASEMFSFKGSGRSSFEGKYELEGDFLVPQELSVSMAASEPKLEYLFNSDKLISFPIKIEGSAAAGPSFKVDAEYIAKRLVVEQGTQQLFKVIDKALGVNQEQGGESSSGSAGQSDASAVKEAVSGILGGIFKEK